MDMANFRVELRERVYYLSSGEIERSEVVNVFDVAQFMMMICLILGEEKFGDWISTPQIKTNRNKAT